MSKRLNWGRVNDEKRRLEHGTENVAGSWSAPGEKDKRPVDEARRGPEDAHGRAVSDYIHELARCDLAGLPPPKVPRLVLERLKLAASQSVAVEWLRRKRQYEQARQKVAEEAVKAAKGEIKDR